MMRRFLLSVLLISPVLGQGESCSNPLPIQGEGLWNISYDNPGWSGFAPDPSCIARTPVEYEMHSLFLDWTPSVSGDYEFRIKNRLSETYLRIFDSVSCTPVCLESQGDFEWSCVAAYHVPGLQAGQHYLIQHYCIACFASPDLDLEITQGTLLCSVPNLDPYEPNDSFATATNLVAGVWPGLFLSSSDRDLFHTSVPPQTLLRVAFVPADPIHRLSSNGYAASGTSFFYQWNYQIENREAAPLDVWYEPVFSDPSFCTRNGPCDTYTAHVEWLSAPCALLEDSFATLGTCFEPHHPLDGFYPSQTLRGPFPQTSSEEFYRFCVYQGASATFAIQYDPLVTQLGLELRTATGPNDPSCGTPVPFGSSNTGSGSETLTVNPGASEVTWYTVRVSGDCGYYDLILQGAGNCGTAVGATACDPAATNSTGSPAQLQAFGNELRSANALQLRVTGLPPQCVGFALGSLAGPPTTLAGFLGTACVASSPANRYWQTLFNHTGGIRQFSIPLWESGPYHQPELAGQTWAFQVLYRETASPFYLWTDAVETTFQ